MVAIAFVVRFLVFHVDFFANDVVAALELFEFVHVGHFAGQFGDFWGERVIIAAGDKERCACKCCVE